MCVAHDEGVRNVGRVLVVGGLLVGCEVGGERPSFGGCWEGACSWGDPDEDGERPDESDEGGDEGETDGRGGDSGPSGGGAGIPCAVQEVLAAHCSMCHGEQPQFGAPMALARHVDFQVPAPSDLTRPAYEVVAERVVDVVKPMPPNGAMSEEERGILLDWIAAGAPEDPSATCGGDSQPDGDPVGPEALPCDVDYEIRAHAGNGSDAFHVPVQGADDLYQCFSFKAPFVSPTQAIAWAPIIDDARVVHHWILYRTTQAQTDGGVFKCDGSLQLTADFVAGWAPGGGNMVLPADVGLELGSPGDWYVLQVHYHNAANYADAFDRSGVGFCVAEQPRPKLAGILTLGTLGINIPPHAQGHAESGTCGWLQTSFWPQLHILGASPHMHELGRAFRTELTRSGGGGEMVTDVPMFNFDNQGMYMNEPEVVVSPGDTLKTTCVYDNPHPYAVGFGEKTGDEMCFNFVLAYPIDALSSRNCGILF
jgi:hypothetical protein